MKREKILFFLEKDRMNLFFEKSEREEIINLDTSLFFKFGEISDVTKCEEIISEIITKISLGPYYLKPNIVVLYDGVSYYDAKFIYRYILRGFNYNKINFITFRDVISKICNIRNVVFFNKDHYVLVEKGEKCVYEGSIDFDPIMIGKSKSTHLHYSDENILWRTFKTYFTNPESYDMIYIGDDK